MASINEDIVLGKHLRAALAAVAAKLNLKANASDVITKSSAQTLTDEEKKQARDNIGAGTSSFSGNYKDLTNQPSAVLYTAQALTDAQKAQVRANIGAGASSFSGNYSDLQNVPTKLSDFTNDQGFATTTEVATAIADANHAKFEVVTSIPTAADAKENILYLFKNTGTGYYDIYAKIGSAVERLDDVSVDLSNYSTTEQVNAAITTATDSMLKYTAQTLSDDQKTQVLTNLGIEFVTDQQVTDMLTELGLTTA